MIPHLLVIGFGPVAGYKYSRCIRDGIDRGVIDGYTVVDKESQKSEVESRLLNLPAQPVRVIYVPDAVLADGAEAGIRWLASEHSDLLGEGGRMLKMLIATEPQAHEAYLRFALDAGYSTLVTKPLVVPMTNNRFDPSKLTARTKSLVDLAKRKRVDASMLCLGRHHDVYDERVRFPIQQIMNRLHAPITSVHLKTASGVWNLLTEYHQREDHPYKYGYGMLMHGAYHYIDIFARTLLLNQYVYKSRGFELRVVAYGAFPSDQGNRVPQSLSRRLTGYNDTYEKDVQNFRFGETDVLAAVSLVLKDTGQTLTLGTLSLEQTTPGMRSWAPFPDVPYNVNGRLHCTDLDVRISTAFAINGHVAKVPITARRSVHDLRGCNIGVVTTRSNALVTDSETYRQEETVVRNYGNSFSYSAESEIFSRWLNDEKTFSDVESHLPGITLLETLCHAVAAPGKEFVVDFDFPTPLGPEYELPETYMASSGLRFAAHVA